MANETMGRPIGARPPEAPVELRGREVLGGQCHTPSRCCPAQTINASRCSTPESEHFACPGIIRIAE